MPITRNRVIYAGTTVLMSDYPCWNNQTGSFSLKSLKRIQSSAISISNPVTREKQIGSSDFAFEKYITQPEISVDLNYIVSDNSNELILGLNATGNVGILKDLAPAQRDRNLFFLLTDLEGQDASSITYTTGLDVFAIGNAFLTDYTFNAQVGEVPNVDVSFSALNMTFQNYTGFVAGSGPSGPFVSDGTKLPAIVLPSGYKSTGSYSLESQNLNTANYLTNQSSRASALAPGDISLQLEQPLMGGIRYSGNQHTN